MEHDSGKAVLQQQHSLRAAKQAQLPQWIVQWNNLALLLNITPFINQNQRFCSLTGSFVRTDSGSNFEPTLIMDTKCKIFLYEHVKNYEQKIY